MEGTMFQYKTNYNYGKMFTFLSTVLDMVTKL